MKVLLFISVSFLITLEAFGQNLGKLEACNNPMRMRGTEHSLTASSELTPCYGGFYKSSTVDGHRTLLAAEGNGSVISKDKENRGCQAGLTCVLTKKLVILGKVIPVKQCMPKDMKVELETVNMDEDTHAAAARMKRFLPLAPCPSEIACLPNFCCPRLVQRCLPKLPEMGTCTLQILHNCGCQDGLECRQTTVITVPIIGIKLPLLQCVRP